MVSPWKTPTTARTLNSRATSLCGYSALVMGTFGPESARRFWCSLAELESPPRMDERKADSGSAIPFDFAQRSLWRRGERNSDSKRFLRAGAEPEKMTENELETIVVESAIVVYRELSYWGQSRMALPSPGPWLSWVQVIPNSAAWFKSA